MCARNNCRVQWLLVLSINCDVTSRTWKGRMWHGIDVWRSSCRLPLVGSCCVESQLCCFDESYKHSVECYCGADVSRCCGVYFPRFDATIGTGNLYKSLLRSVFSLTLSEILTLRHHFKSWPVKKLLGIITFLHYVGSTPGMTKSI